MTDVLIFTPRYPPQGGGSSIYFSNLVGEMYDEHKFEVITFQNPEKPLITNSDDATIYRVIPRYKSLPAVLRLFIESIVSFLFSLWVLRQIEVAHVHASSYATPGVALGTMLARVPILYDCRDELFSPRLVQLGRTLFWFSCADNVDSILINNGIPSERIVRTPVVNPPYVEELYSGCTGTHDDTFDVIFVGRLIEEKGVHLLIRAFEDFVNQHSDARLTLVGDDPVGTINEQITESELDEELDLTGELKHQEAIQKINRADVLVLPSFDEARPRVIIEAFSVGVPVIATEVGSIPELVDDSDNGILIDHSTEEIFKTLETLYGSPKLIHKMSQSAKAQSEQWSWETVNERVSSTYKKAATD